jgi:hypothetical protein
VHRRCAVASADRVGGHSASLADRGYDHDKYRRLVRKRVPFNPRDNPTSFEGVAFAESTGAVAGVILLVLFVIRRARRQVRLGHRRVAGT